MAPSLPLSYRRSVEPLPRRWRAAVGHFVSVRRVSLEILLAGQPAGWADMEVERFRYAVGRLRFRRQPTRESVWRRDWRVRLSLPGGRLVLRDLPGVRTRSEVLAWVRAEFERAASHS